MLEDLSHGIRLDRTAVNVAELELPDIIVLKEVKSCVRIMHGPREYSPHRLS